MLARLRSHLSDDRGISLVEVLVAIALSVIVGAIAGNGLITGLRATSEVQTRSQALSELQVTAERVAREIRAAAPVQQVVTGANETLQVRVFRGTTCWRFTYRVEGNELVQYRETLTPAPAPPGSPVLPNACTDPAPTIPPPASADRKVLVTDLAPGVVFEYQDGSGTPLSFASPPGPLEEISTVTLTVRRALRDNRTLEVSTVVNLRNIVE